MDKRAKDKALQRKKQLPLQAKKEGSGIHTGPLGLGLSLLPPLVQCLGNSNDAA